MRFVLLLLLLLHGCASAPLVGDRYVHVRGPIVVEGKWSGGRDVCAVALTHDEVITVYYSRSGCAVVHRTVVVPTLLEQRARSWRPK